MIITQCKVMAYSYNSCISHDKDGLGGVCLGHVVYSEEFSDDEEHHQDPKKNNEKLVEEL